MIFDEIVRKDPADPLLLNFWLRDALGVGATV
jgi:hypothetical protein